MLFAIICDFKEGDGTNERETADPVHGHNYWYGRQTRMNVYRDAGQLHSTTVDKYSLEVC